MEKYYYPLTQWLFNTCEKPASPNLDGIELLGLVIIPGASGLFFTVKVDFLLSAMNMWMLTYEIILFLPCVRNNPEE